MGYNFVADIMGQTSLV